MSHIGLGGRLREAVPPSGGGPDSGVGSRESFKSSSISQAGLGSRGGRGRGAGGGRGASGIDAGGGIITLLLLLPSASSVARLFPLSMLWLEDAAGCWLERSWSCVLIGSTLVLLLRKGLLNASWMRFALTWPNPGRFCSCSDDARDIAAKLWERHGTVRSVIKAREWWRYGPQKTSAGSRRRSCSLC